MKQGGILKKCMLMGWLFLSTVLYAQPGDPTLKPLYGRLKNIPDVTWQQMSVAQKIQHCLTEAELFSQLCGRKPLSSRERNTTKYIYFNTLHLNNFGEYVYSKRQRVFFEESADSIAWYFRKAVLQDSSDLFYWHKIVFAMPPNWKVLSVLEHYYEWEGKQKSEPLTLMMMLMERDSFPDFYASVFHKKMEDFDTYEDRIAHTAEKSKEILDLASSYEWDLYRSDANSGRKWTDENYFISNALRSRDSLYDRTLRLSDAAFNRLTAREFLAYADLKPEHYMQICSAIPNLRDEKRFLYESFWVGSITPDSYSERQKKMAKDKRDSCAFLLAAHLAKDPYDLRRYDVPVIMLCNAWETIPSLVEAQKMYGFRSDRFFIPLRYLMRQNKYEPYFKFLLDINKAEGNSEPTSVIPNTRENRERLLELAMDMYREKSGQ